MRSLAALLPLLALLPVALSVPTTAPAPTCPAGTGALVCCRTYLAGIGGITNPVLPTGQCVDGMLLLISFYLWSLESARFNNVYQRRWG